jgi:hypothetical protein
MTHRVEELRERQAQLQARCSEQRARITREVAGIETRFAGFDRVAGMARSTLLHPVVIAGGTVALLAIGRSRGMRLVGRLYLLTTAARRLIQTVKMFESVASKGNSTVGGRQL